MTDNMIEEDMVRTNSSLGEKLAKGSSLFAAYYPAHCFLKNFHEYDISNIGSKIALGVIGSVGNVVGSMVVTGVVEYFDFTSPKAEIISFPYENGSKDVMMTEDKYYYNNFWDQTFGLDLKAAGQLLSMGSSIITWTPFSSFFGEYVDNPDKRQYELSFVAGELIQEKSNVKVVDNGNVLLDFELDSSSNLSCYFEIPQGEAKDLSQARDLIRYNPSDYLSGNSSLRLKSYITPSRFSELGIESKINDICLEKLMTKDLNFTRKS